MKKVKITVMKMAHYADLIEQYENPIEHACDVQVGQTFVSVNATRPDGFCDSAWGNDIAVRYRACQRWRQLLRRLDEESALGNDFLQRRLSPRQLSARGV